MGRELKRTLIVDNSSASFMFHPEYAIECISWFDDKNDTELGEMAEFLVKMAGAADIRPAMQEWRAKHPPPRL